MQNHPWYICGNALSFIGEIVIKGKVEAKCLKAKNLEEINDIFCEIQFLQRFFNGESGNLQENSKLE